MADNRRSYNAVLRALRRSHGLTQPQARVAWRGLKEHLDKTPRLKDLKAHPRITAQEVKRAPARERALRAAKSRAEKKTAATTTGGGGRRISPPISGGGGGGGGRMVIGAERMRELEIEWDAFDADTGWDDPDPYGETA